MQEAGGCQPRVTLADHADTESGLRAVLDTARVWCRLERELGVCRRVSLFLDAAGAFWAWILACGLRAGGAEKHRLPTVDCRVKRILE